MTPEMVVEEDLGPGMAKETAMNKVQERQIKTQGRSGEKEGRSREACSRNGSQEEARSKEGRADDV